MTASGIAEAAVETFMAREQQRFLAQNPQSVALAERARRALFDGVPMHWMSDWSTPCPLFVARAHGARFHDVGLTLVFPIRGSYSEAAKFPVPIHIVEDGTVELPK